MRVISAMTENPPLVWRRFGVRLFPIRVPLFPIRARLFPIRVPLVPIRVPAFPIRVRVWLKFLEEGQGWWYPFYPLPLTNMLCLYPPPISRYFCKDSLMTPHTPPHFKHLYCCHPSPDPLPPPKILIVHFLHFSFVFTGVPSVFPSVWCFRYDLQHVYFHVVKSIQLVASVQTLI